MVKVDAYTIQPEEHDDAPEWTDEMFEQSDMYINHLMFDPKDML